MSNYAEMLLSKIVDSNDVTALARYGVEESHLATEGERKALRFIKKYSAENGGSTPSPEVLAANVEDFTYLPQIEDSYEYLAKQIKGHAAKLGLKDLLENQFGRKFSSTSDGNILIDDLISELQQVRIRTSVREKVGLNLKTETESFLTEYQRRKEGKSFKLWKSKFPTINNAIGGYLSGNLYTFYGRSGRGKSVIVMEEALEAAMQGAKVLIWAMEMSEFEWVARAYSSLSARQGIFDAKIEGVDYDVGFDNKAMLTGKLSEEFEKALAVFLPTLNEMIPGEIILRAKDHVDFQDRSLKRLESDIREIGADFVVVDAFYHLDYEKNTSRTTGGDAANTSMKLNRIAGYTQATVAAITQAEELKGGGKDDEGNRELSLPERNEAKKTSALLEDATNLIAIDSLDGIAQVGIKKGRNGGEDTVAELLYMPNYGLVRELETGQAAASQFDF
jgi:archaellum biogenesis ATPase FlaH